MQGSNYIYSWLFKMDIQTFKDNINSNGIPRSSHRNICDIPLNSEVLEFLDIPRVHCSLETIS
jgi:hypothetical protein